MASIKKLIKLRKERRYRYETGHLLISGKKLVEDIARTHEILTLLACEQGLIPKEVHAKEVQIVSEEVMARITGLRSPDGLAAELLMPLPSSLASATRLLVLDKVADPGNLGTLLRTASLLGWEGAFLLEGCCDPYNDKALRAARGAPLYLPWKSGSWKELDALIRQNHLSPLVANLQGTPTSQLSPPTRPLLIIGNEARGPSEEAIARGKPITIPMCGPLESFNAATAGSILLFCLRS